jgi:lipopolysaccharide transport system ATP-binding protein
LASLLEVGTGFHPELTGRENIFLNGAILGMTKKEIINKFDEIVDFSGCELYIDTPTKRYSSGMTVRLGFAVAAFLDPEILIVDEVLAVGDAEFQLKAIGKMKSISKEEGRTVIFVSHNLNSIKQLCTRCALMEKGTLKFVGSVDECISKYLNVESAFDIEKISNKPKLVELPIFLQKCNFILKNKTDRVGSFNVEDQVCIKFEFNKTQDLTGVFLHLRISDENENLIIETDSTENSTNVFDTSRIGNLSVEYSFPPRTFNKGKYFISIGLASAKAVPFQIQSLDNFLSFEVLAYGTYRERHRRSLTAIIPQLDYQWF